MPARLTGRFGDLDHPRRGDPRAALNVGDVVFLEQIDDTLVQLISHATRTANDLSPIVAHIVCYDAPLLGVALEPVIELGGPKQGLGGDTAPIQADATEFVTLDACDGHAQLCSTDRSDIPARSAPNHHQIE